MSHNYERFGKYILLEKLASGGMAEVYLCKSTGAVGVNKFVAIKRILPQYSENPEFIEMFKEEAKIAVNLTHSNIVSIFDFGVEKNQFYIVMDYLEGKNLRQLTNEIKKQNRALTIDQIVYIIKEAAAGLDHAHRGVDSATGKPLNVIHRDISPQNLMLSYDGEVKLIDFGIAKAETQIESTKAGTLKGKYGYMSPEQADGQPIDSSTDIFSLGIILWELLANDRLFTASNEAAILRKIKECQIPPIRKLNPSVPQELEKIVHRALAKDKSLRYQTTASFHRDLNRYLNTAFPEFSPHDFSVFMKETFSSEFLEIQKKRVDFSKVDAQFAEKSDKTEINGIPPRPQPINIQSDRTIIDERRVSFGDEIEVDTSANIKVNLGEMRSSTSTGISPKSSTMISKAGQVGVKTNISIKVPQEPKKNKLAWLIPASIGIVAITAGVFALNGKKDKNSNHAYVQSSQSDKNTSSTRPQSTKTSSLDIKESIENTNLASEAPTEKVSLTIYVNNPTVDRILIDNQDYGVSPVRTLVNVGQPVTIRLEKEGYEPYEIVQTFKEVANTRNLKMPAQNELVLVKIKPAVNLGSLKYILINGKRPIQADGETFSVKMGRSLVELSDGFAIYGAQEIFVQNRENQIFEIKVQGGNIEAIEKMKSVYGK